ncbi:MAG: SMC-Scp complex subunit ScpB [Nitrospiraceae bacterium]
MTTSTDTRDEELALTAEQSEQREATSGSTGGEGEADRMASFEERELKALLEALLFVSPEPVPIDRFMTVLGAISKSELRNALRQLREDFDREGRGLQLVELAGGYQIMTRPDYAPWLKRLERTKAAPKLSRSALETLAIIAYKQPVIRAEIENIRGVEVSSVLRTLLERKLVRMVGRKEDPGRPILYGTTKFFLQHFGLRDLAELPPLREVKELGESAQAFLPVGEGGLEITGSEAAALASIDRPEEPSQPDPANPA